MSKILAGPWVGEFGWELFCWQGHLRNLSSRHDIIVVSDPSMEFLYQDFHKGFEPFVSPYKNRNAYLCEEYVTYSNDSLEYDEHINPQDGIVCYAGKDSLCKNFFDQKFVKYGSASLEKYDVVIHARNTDKCGTVFRNWPEKNWIKISKYLSSQGLSCTSIGLTDYSMYVEGTIDNRGLSMSNLADLLASSRVILGPSSGPIHYAALCGTDQLVWGESKNEEKYKTRWNPFKVNVKYHHRDSWNPSVETILGMIKGYFA